jgi:predicted nucleic acid-binding protein
LLIERGDELCYTLQGLTEFWNVCTRPAVARGGFGMSVEETERRIRMVERLGIFLPDTEGVRSAWRHLVYTHQVQGVQVHDARLLASMLTHNLSRLLTFNGRDFQRYVALAQAYHPQEVVDSRV